MKKSWLNDILRDKGSAKYSITKTLALGMSIFLLVYLIWITIYKGTEVDHVLVGELIATILTLTGFKNNFGVNTTKKTSDGQIQAKITRTSDDVDEGTF